MGVPSVADLAVKVPEAAVPGQRVPDSRCLRELKMFSRQKWYRISWRNDGVGDRVSSFEWQHYGAAV